MHGISSTTRRRLVSQVIVCAAIAAAAVSIAIAPTRLQAQYFGQNKVTYRNFDFKEMHTRHFDILYYQRNRWWWQTHGADSRSGGTNGTRSRCAMPSRANRSSCTRIRSAFAQGNIAPQFVGGSVGGFTEPYRDRAVLPMTGDYASDATIFSATNSCTCSSST